MLFTEQIGELIFLVHWLPISTRTKIKYIHIFIYFIAFYFLCVAVSTLFGHLLLLLFLVTFLKQDVLLSATESCLMSVALITSRNFSRACLDSDFNTGNTKRLYITMDDLFSHMAP